MSGSPKRSPRSLFPRATLLVTAALVLLVSLNILSARHYRRLDATSAKRFSLSPATVSTLQNLSSDVDVWVTVPRGDPMFMSLRQLLSSYEGVSTRVRTHYIDPDQDTLALIDLRKRYAIDVHKSEDGRIAADATLIVAQGDRHWFIVPSDMVTVSATDDQRAKPSEELALTRAIRKVVGGKKVTLCFSEGHGEPSLADPSFDGLGRQKRFFELDNYNTANVDFSDPAMAEGRAKALQECEVLVIADPKSPFAPQEANDIDTYLKAGGNLFLAAGPIHEDQSQAGMIPAGLNGVLAPYGIALTDALVIEKDEHLIVPQMGGLQFVALPKDHPITTSLVRLDPAKEVPRVLLHFSRPLERVASGDSVAALEILSTSDASYALLNVAGASTWKEIPERKVNEPKGPFAVGVRGGTTKEGSYARARITRRRRGNRKLDERTQLGRAPSRSRRSVLCRKRALLARVPT